MAFILNFLILAVPFLLYTTIFFFVLLKTTRKSSPNLPPGPWKLPLIGNLHNLAGALPHRALQRLSLTHGPLMHVQLGELSTVVVSSSDTAREVMKTHDIKFASRPQTLSGQILSYDCTSITFSPPGDYWRQLRRICAAELLSSKRVQSFRPLRERVFLDMVKWMVSNEGFPVNFTEKIVSSTYDFTMRATFGANCRNQKRFLELLTESFTLAAGFDVAELFPSIKLLYRFSRTRKRLMEVSSEVDEILSEIIHDHKTKTSGSINYDGVAGEDVVDVLLRYQDPSVEIPLTTNNIKAVLMDVLGAGSETSATTMDWAMAEMLKNPRVLGKAQDEVRGIFDTKGGFIDEAYISELKYLKAVIKETLRLHAPVPLLLPRKCDEACEINGYKIPVDTKVIVNAWAINRDPKQWQDPESFNPERFLDSPVDFRGSHFEYIPFGSGKRICPGISYGLANVEVPLAMLLYHLDWELGGGVKPEEMEMMEGFGITAKRAKDLFVVPTVKRPFPAAAK